MQTIRTLQEEGTIFSGGAVWRGDRIMRLSVSNFQTDLDQAECAAQAIIAAYRSVRTTGAAT